MAGLVPAIFLYETVVTSIRAGALRIELADDADVRLARFLRGARASCFWALSFFSGSSICQR